MIRKRHTFILIRRKEMLGIYCYIDKKDNSIVYVGKDSNIHRKVRMYAHKKPSQYNTQPFNRILQNNLSRYIYQVLVWDVKDQDTLNALEIQYIRQLKPKFNYTDGGDGNGGYKHSEEYKKKMSESRKGEDNPFYGKKHSEKTKEHLRRLNLGKKMSEESKRKMSLSKRGKNHPQYGKPISEETKKKISQANMGMSRTKEFVEGNIEVNNKTGFAMVGKCNKNDFIKGYHFKYLYYDENGKKKALSSVDLFKLKSKVDSKGLPWRIVNIDKAIATVRNEMRWR